MGTGYSFSQEMPGASQTNENVLGLRGGLKILVGPSWLSTDVEEPDLYAAENNGSKLSFAYGGFADYYFAAHYAIGGELRYLYTGSSFIYTPDKANRPDSNLNRTLSLQYVEVPIYLKFRSNEVSYTRFFGQIGITPGINTRARMESFTSSRTGTTSIKEGQNVQSQVKTFNVGLNIGLGAEYNLGGSTSLIASLNWNNGLTNIWDRKSDDRPGKVPGRQEELINTKLQTITLNLGILF